MRILDLIDLNYGDTLKQGDSTRLRFQLSARDYLLPDNEGKQARIVFHFNNSVVHEEYSTVQRGNVVEFSINEILPPNVYVLEIHVDGQIFPSDDYIFKIKLSAAGIDHEITKSYGINNIIERAVDLVSAKFINLTKEKLGLGNVINVKQASEVEVSQARGSYPDLRSRLDETDNKQRQTASQLPHKVDKDGVEQIDYTNFNQRTKEMLVNAGENGFPVLEEDSVSRSNIVSKAVSMDKTDFIRDTRNLFEGMSIPRGSISSNESMNIIYTEEGFSDSVFLPYVPIENNTSYTISAQGLGNRFLVAFSNNLELGSPIERIHYYVPTTVINMSNTLTVTNTSNYKYLLIYSGLWKAIPGDVAFEPNEIKVIQGTQSPLLQEKVYINDKEVVFNNDDFAIVDNLYRGYKIPSAGISSAESSNYIYTEPDFGDSVNLPYLPIEPNKSYTVKASLDGTMNRFILAFSNNLEVGSPIERIVTITDGSMNAYTFTNNGGYKYLLIYAGFWKIGVKTMTLADIEVVEGNEMPDNLPTLIVGGKEVAFMSDTPPENHEAFNSRQNSEYYYSEEHPSAHFNNTAEVYAAYDDLMAKSDGYMTRELLGKDDWDNPIYCYNFERPEHRTSYEIKKPRIGITSSVHGNERSMVNGLYNFMSDMVLNPYKQEKIERMKSLINFYVIPVAVPTGFDDNTRTNRNGVNINRNFDYHWEEHIVVGPTDEKGPAPASEKETQILQNWMVDKDLDQYLDFHKSDMHSDNHTASWFVSTNLGDDNEWTIPSRKEYLNVIAHLSTRYSQKYEELPNHINFGHAKTYARFPQTQQYANSIGILGTLLEMSEVFTQLSGDQRRLRNTWATDLLGNYLFEIARRYI